MRATVAILLSMLLGCGSNPGPQPPIEPPVTNVPPEAEQCHLMTPPAQALCYDNPQGGQSFDEWDPNWGYVCALPEGGTMRVGLPEDCPVAPPLPQPQCTTFINRGGTVSTQSGACDCFIGHEPQPPCSPVPEGCSFPQGVPADDFSMGPVRTNFAATVNTAMREITGCNIGSDCPTGMMPDEWMHAVIDAIKVTGLCAGRHVDTTPGGTDEIAVARNCKHPWEGYKIYNYGGGKVIWSPNANRPSWTITHDYCSEGPVEPPVGDCPAPHPDLASMKFKTKEAGNHLDTTWTTVSQEPFCREIGLSPMADGTLRAGCPVRPECGPDDPPEAICHERAACEAELCDQKWECNGEPYPGWRGNNAQTDCRGHYKTWCSADGSTAVLEGDR